jgi:hypothetical protein
MRVTTTLLRSSTFPPLFTYMPLVQQNRAVFYGVIMKDHNKSDEALPSIAKISPEALDKASRIPKCNGAVQSASKDATTHSAALSFPQ